MPAMTLKTRWGILATGDMAAAFAQDLQRLADAQVVAVGSRTAERARGFADRFGIPRAYGSWEELARDDDIDVVHISTPHTAHHDAAALCIAAGRSVLVEKPFTINRSTSYDLMERARRRGVFAMEGMWMRCNPTVRRLAGLVAGGLIGEVVSLRAGLGIADPGYAGHRLRDRNLGGGALLDLGVYPVAFAHLLLGRPDGLSASAVLTPAGVDAQADLRLRYASGAVATLSCGFLAELPGEAVLVGTAGRIVVRGDFTCPSALEIHREGMPAEVISASAGGHDFTHEAREVMRCLRAGLLQSPLVPWQATLEVMDVIDRARAAVGVSYPGE